MTLVLALTTPESVWTLTDRRLTDRNTVVREDARKIMLLSTTDGLAILSYAGLGSTARGTEPADWMSNVLRGRNWPLENALAALAEALKREMPPHLGSLRVRQGPSHNVVIAGFVNGEPRLYSIDLALSSDRHQSTFRHTCWIVSGTETGIPRTPRLALAGSGAVVLQREKTWQRHLLGLARAYDRQRISALTVADAFATLNLRVSQLLTDGTVGPRSIVVRRNRIGGVHRGGGAHQLYTGVTRDRELAALPMVDNGVDTRAFLAAIAPHMTKQLRELRAGRPNPTLDADAVNAALAELPEAPDETLR